MRGVQVHRFVELAPGTPHNSVLRATIENYRDLIARGADCEDGF